MTYAPMTLLELAAYWKRQGGVNLGIVGDTDHATKGVSYHLGKDQLRAGAYSATTPRDKAGLTNAASAIDLGRLLGSYLQLQAFSMWLAKRCLAGTPDTNDVREVIFANGNRVMGYKDGVDHLIPDYGDNSHLTHTHVSYYRDSEHRSKLDLFAAYFEVQTMATFEWNGDTARLGSLTVNGPGHSYLRLKDGTLHPAPPPFPKRAMGPVVIEKGTVLGDTIERRTGWLIPQEAAFILATDSTFVPDGTDTKHRVVLTVDGNEKWSGSV